MFRTKIFKNNLSRKALVNGKTNIIRDTRSTLVEVYNIQSEEIKVYSSIQEAAKALSCSPSTIRNRLNMNGVKLYRKIYIIRQPSEVIVEELPKVQEVVKISKSNIKPKLRHKKSTPGIIGSKLLNKNVLTVKGGFLSISNLLIKLMNSLSNTIRMLKNGIKNCITIFLHSNVVGILTYLGLIIALISWIIITFHFEDLDIWLLYFNDNSLSNIYKDFIDIILYWKNRLLSFEKYDNSEYSELRSYANKSTDINEYEISNNSWKQWWNEKVDKSTLENIAYYGAITIATCLVVYGIWCYWNSDGGDNTQLRDESWFKLDKLYRGYKGNNQIVPENLDRVNTSGIISDDRDRVSTDIISDMSGNNGINQNVKEKPNLVIDTESSRSSWTQDINKEALTTPRLDGNSNIHNSNRITRWPSGKCKEIESLETPVATNTADSTFTSNLNRITRWMPSSNDPSPSSTVDNTYSNSSNRITRWMPNSNESSPIDNPNLSSRDIRHEISKLERDTRRTTQWPTVETLRSNRIYNSDNSSINKDATSISPKTQATEKLSEIIEKGELTPNSQSKAIKNILGELARNDNSTLDSTKQIGNHLGNSSSGGILTDLTNNIKYLWGSKSDSSNVNSSLTFGEENLNNKFESSALSPSLLSSRDSVSSGSISTPEGYSPSSSDYFSTDKELKKKYLEFLAQKNVDTPEIISNRETFIYHSPSSEMPNITKTDHS